MERNMNVSKTFELLKKYIEDEEYQGWDPFDGLNSKVFQAVPYLNNIPFARLLWIQFFKKSPINFRNLAFIEKGLNPKGLSLFLSGYCNLYQCSPRKEYLERIEELSALLIQKICKGYSGAAWGYNFDWQARAFFQPKGTPSIVVTSFAGSALLDAYRITKNQEFLSLAKSSCEFIRNDLYKTYDENNNYAFSYCPLDRTQVFNASFLGTRLFCRVYEHTGDKELLKEAKKVITYISAYQLPNGAWPYSPLPFHQWIDNFHTGFNLESLYTYQMTSQDFTFNDCFQRGFRYYTENFFEGNGAPRYYHNQLYPVDLHNTAQLIITLSRTGTFMQNIDLVDKVLNWSIENMFYSKKGYFYYNKWKHVTNKIPYIRWTQAWMFFGISEYLLNFKTLEV